MVKHNSHILNGKLFIEPTEDIQRDDPFSGPLGFMLGGMALPNKLELAQQYYDAAHTLVEVIKRHEIEDYKLVNPVLYLYRHSLELILKYIMHSKATHHRLDALSDDFVKFVKEQSTEKVPTWITNRLKEIAHIDPNSMAFRYAEDKYGNKKVCSAVDGETYVSVLQLQEVMSVLYDTLIRLAGKLEID